MSFTSLTDFSQELAEKSAGNGSFETTLEELIRGYRGQNVFDTRDHQYVLEPHGFKELFGERLGFPHKAMMALSENPDLQVQVAQELIRNKPDRPIHVETEGDKIVTVLGRDYYHARNTELVFAVQTMVAQGQLPDDLKVAAHHIGNHGRTMTARFISEQWTFDTSPNGKSDLNYGAFAITNDERGQGAFTARVGLARVLCFNWTLAEAIIKVDHKHTSWIEFHQSLTQVVDAITGYAGEMRDRMQNAHGMKFDNPQIVFEKVLADMKLPGRVKNAAKEYWLSETGQESAYDVIQATTYGTQLLATPTNRGNPNWDLRNRVEENIMPFVIEVAQNEDKYVKTVGDLRSELDHYDPGTEVVSGGHIISVPTGDREVIKLS